MKHSTNVSNVYEGQVALHLPVDVANNTKCFPWPCSIVALSLKESAPLVIMCIYIYTYRLHIISYRHLDSEVPKTQSKNLKAVKKQARPKFGQKADWTRSSLGIGFTCFTDLEVTECFMHPKMHARIIVCMHVC